MPLQNRVTPWGALEAVPTRYKDGAFGNRGGALHNSRKEIVKQWSSKAWLACRMDGDKRTRKRQRDDNRAFNGRKRVVMRPGFYTELFFLDQYVATASGHRPCACCRRKEFVEFQAAWARAHGDGKWSAGQMDTVLHSERTRPPCETELSELPDGTFVSLEDEPRDAWLVWKGEILKWSHEGYGGERQPVSSVDAPVSLLTPASMVATMRCGFVPGDVHASALTTPGPHGPVKRA